QPRGLLVAVAPGEVGDLRSDRLRVVVREGACAAVAGVDALEPFGVGGMAPRALRLRQTGIRNVACQRVLEDELRLGGADEASLDERSHLCRRADERAEAGGRERPADHGGCPETVL